MKHAPASPLPTFHASARALTAAAFVAVAAGCSTALPAFVGEPHGAQTNATSNVPPPPAGTAFAPNSIDSLAPRLGTRTMLPPTVPPDADMSASDAPEPNGSGGPRPPIAVTPIAPDQAALSSLAAAARRAGGGNARFVLLVLTPPAADTAAIGRNSAQARAAADVALTALRAAGIDADRVEVSAATGTGAENGELRLYLR